jgi:hypothetical protein
MLHCHLVHKRQVLSSERRQFLNHCVEILIPYCEYNSSESWFLMFMQLEWNTKYLVSLWQNRMLFIPCTSTIASLDCPYSPQWNVLVPCNQTGHNLDCFPCNLVFSPLTIETMVSLLFNGRQRKSTMKILFSCKSTNTNLVSLQIDNERSWFLTNQR